MKKLNKKGFTLVELIVVIAIIGILAAVLVPSVTSYISKAQKSSATQNAANKYQEYVLAVTDICQADVNEKTKDRALVYATGNFYCIIIDGTVKATESTLNKAKEEAAKTFTGGALNSTKSAIEIKENNVLKRTITFVTFEDNSVPKTTDVGNDCGNL